MINHKEAACPEEKGRSGEETINRWLAIFGLLVFCVGGAVARPLEDPEPPKLPEVNLSLSSLKPVELFPSARSRFFSAKVSGPASVPPLDPLQMALTANFRPPQGEGLPHPWAKIHFIHITAIHNLCNRFLRAIYSRNDWLSRTKVYPLINLVPGRLHFGVEARPVTFRLIVP
jgi:hypothetical protein